MSTLPSFVWYSFCDGDIPGHTRHPFVQLAPVEVASRWVENLSSRSSRYRHILFTRPFWQNIRLFRFQSNNEDGHGEFVVILFSPLFSVKSNKTF